jgi:hypothetical protein
VISKRSEEPEPAIPPPTPERILIRVALEAYMATAHSKPRQRARAFFDFGSRLLQNEETVSALFPVKSNASRGELNRVRREACAIWEGWAPTLLARIPPV